MLGLISRYKILIIGLALVIAGAVWYGLTPSSSAPTSLVTSASSNPSGSDTLVATLIALRAVKLDGTIFSEPAFIGLKDYSTPIIPEPVGRPDPFAPLSVGAAPTASSTKSAQIFKPLH